MRSRHALAAMRPRTAAELAWEEAERADRKQRRAFWIMCAIHAIGWPVLFILATGGF